MRSSPETARPSPAVGPSPFRAVADGVRIAVKLTPKAAQDRIQGTMAGVEGGVLLKLGVTAAPEAGKANEAAIALLAKAWDVPKRALEVVSGATERRKTFHLAGAPVPLMAKLNRWLEEFHG